MRPSCPSRARGGPSTCSRCMRWPGARASSFTRAAAFFERHSSCRITRVPTETEKPPSSRMRTACGLLLIDSSACVIPSDPAIGRVSSLSWGHALSSFGCSFSYNAEPCANGTTSVFDCIQRQLWLRGLGRCLSDRLAEAWARSGGLETTTPCAEGRDRGRELGNRG